MKEIPLGNVDADADVCRTSKAEWLAAHVPVVGVTRQPLKLEWFNAKGIRQATAHVFTGTEDGGALPRLAPTSGWIWLAHRAVVNGVMQATVRRIWPDRSVTTEADGVLGVADGPLALSGDWVAWHDSKAKVIYGRRLTVPLGPRVTLRAADPSVVGTGLSHMDGEHPVTVTENNAAPYALAGMSDAVRREGIVTGQNPKGGIEVRTGENQPQGTLLAGQFTNQPRGARDGDAMAAVHWGSNARLVLFTVADL